MGWDSIDWQLVDRYVYKLQTRIYAASRHGEIKQVRKLQRTLMNSWCCKVLALRRVTQENRGKKTAGVDGVKSLSPVARMKLVKQLKLTGKSKPTRRVWIPKPGKDEKRPLGIPTMYDRALQGVVKSNLPYNLNGRQILKPQATVLDQGEPVMMLYGQLNRQYSRKQNTFLMPILLNVSSAIRSV